MSNGKDLFAETSIDIEMRRILRIVLLASFVLASLGLTTSPVTAENHPTIVGRLTDEVSGVPIANASILIQREHAMGRSSLGTLGYTDEQGAYTLELTFEGRCWLFAFHDLPSSPGVDYLPGFAELDVERGRIYNVSFGLLPGASLRFSIDDVTFIENPNPRTRYFHFSVSPQEGFGNSLLKYGSLYGQDIGLDPGHVVVPAGCTVKVDLEAIFFARMFDGLDAAHRFSIDDWGKPFSLTQGESRAVDLKRLSLDHNMNLTVNYLKECYHALAIAEEDGLYLVEEEKHLTEAQRLLNASESYLLDSSFQECYAEMRNAFLVISNVQNHISLVYIEARTAAILLVPFFGIFSLSLSYLVYEKRRPRITVFLAVFIPVLGIASILFVGFKLVSSVMLALDAMLTVVVCLILPHFYKESKSDRGRLSLIGAIALTLSIAKRNLRRRKYNTTMITSSLLILVWSFIVLTSVSEGRGLIQRDVQGRSPLQGILVRRLDPRSSTRPFQPLEDYVTHWLTQNKDVEVIAQKAESTPSLDPVFILQSDNEETLIRGVIGVDPHAEPHVTSLNTVVEGGSGEFLQSDQDVLISKGMAEILSIKIGDVVGILNMQFRVAGIFDPVLISRISDFDGNPILPQKLVLVSANGGVVPMLFYCNPNEIVIMTTNASLGIPSVSLSRIDVLPKATSDIAHLVRLIVLNLEVDVWASTPEGVTYSGMDEYIEIEGFSLVVPFLLILGSVFSLMLNSVFERRREIPILSALGLNPTHVALIFIAEGIIIGFVAGGSGYILGLVSYRFLSLFHSQIEVVQKVSINWGLAAVVFSITAAVLGTSIPAMKASILTTPSLTRQWSLSEVTEKTKAYWRIDLPVYLQDRYVEEFTKYLWDELKSLQETVSTVKLVQELSYAETQEDNHKIRRLRFIFSGFEMNAPLTDCEVQIFEDRESNMWRASLLYYVSRIVGKRYGRDAHTVASLIRMAVLKWSDVHFLKKD